MAHAANGRSTILQRHAGWRSRGYLPHFDSPGAVQHIIFRVADALPARTMVALAGEPAAQRLRRIDQALDKGYGARLLGSPAVAEIVERALLHFDCERYRLSAWCIMPTHVHVLVEQMAGHPLSQIVQSWKSFSAHAANKMLERTKPIWAPEYYDRFMRDGTQFDATHVYIENNPVAAGLCAAPHDWRFSSAWGGHRL